MLYVSVAVWLSAISCTQITSVFAQDAEGWYKSHPNMARIKHVNQDTHQIIDEYGRTRFFHGTNVVMKEAPWYRPFEWTPGVSSFGERDVQNMHDLGLNIVRLGHSWAGAEPVRGEYNQTFLDIMKKQTKLAEEHGIYVLVDVHQDVLAKQLCGHGVPDWFVKKDWVTGFRRFPFPQKLKPFTTDDDGFPSPDAFAAYWKKLASEYVDTTNVVGYNLLNEPWTGDSYADPTILVPGVADRKNLEGLWNRASKQIRTVDNDTLIWFEGTTFDVLSGFNNVPLGDGSKTVHSFHYYKPPQLGPLKDTLYNRQKDNVRLKTAGVLTELTFWMGDDKQMAGLAEAMTATDANMVSWIGWAYENLYNGASGKSYPQLQKHYSRAYPAAIAGTPTSFGFEETSGIFKLNFTSDPAIGAPTEIILPTSTFPNGYEVRVLPSGSLLQYEPDDRTLALFTSKAMRKEIEISIEVSSK
ncbi:unnamed protein product [Fusarium fujikuroi]|nr:unnamed protein product [Fusarium fujikuroi]